ncbi:hypothetical protein [Flaviaesturariibacter terrae]
MRLPVILLFLLCSNAVLAQTTPIRGDSVIYRGLFVLDSGSGMDRSADVLGAARSMGWTFDARQAAGPWLLYKDLPAAASGERQTLQLSLELTGAPEGLRYRVGNVAVLRTVKGEKTDTLPAARIVGGLDESGTVAIAAERLLDLIDMRIEALLSGAERRLVARRKP